jgi:glycosyltransferase involved in cell wall biosynthesis
MLGIRDEESLLTVIIPYLPNSENHLSLKQLLDDALDLPIKIILCVDSNDMQIISELESYIGASKNTEIRFQENKSPGLTRNLGINLVSTSYFAFWDADDQIQPLEVLSLLDEVSQNLPILGVSRFGSVSSMDKTKEWSRVNFKNTIAVGANPGLWRWIFKTSNFKDIRFSDLAIGEDVEYLLRVLSLGEPVTYFDQITYKYRKPRTEIVSQSIRGRGSLSNLVPELISIYKGLKQNKLISSSILAKQFLSARMSIPGKDNQAPRRRMKKALLSIPITNFALVLVMVLIHAGGKANRIIVSWVLDKVRSVKQ